MKIQTGGTIRAEGPTLSGFFNHKSWYVNYRLLVPRHIGTHLATVNGSIGITDVAGSIHVETTNGGLSLANLAGDLHASTVNGGVTISLAGNQWHGGGLSVSTTNGPIALKAPDHYSAHLVASTVNGPISVGFPVTVQGEIRHHLDTNLGGGGATLQLETVNGPVSIGHD